MQRPADKSLQTDLSMLSNDSMHAPIHVAVLAGDIDAVSSMLRNGTDPEVRTRNGNTSLHLAVETNCAYMVNRVLLYSNASRHNNAIRTPLHLAVKHANASVIMLLLNDRASIHARDMDGNTPFHESFRLPRDGLLRSFIHLGADVTDKDGLGRNALHLAAYYQNHWAIRYLLCRQKMNPNALTENRETPLHLLLKYAKIEDNVDALFLRQYGHCPVRYSLLELIMHGAEVNALDGDNKTPLDYAIKLKRCDLIQDLIISGAEYYCNNGKRMSLTLAISEFDAPAFNYIWKSMKKDVDVSKVSLIFSIIHTIEEVQMRNKMVRFLLENGVRSNERDDNNTPLIHYAIEKRAIELLSLLIEFGADLEVINNYNQSPLQAVIVECHRNKHWWRYSYYKMMRALLDGGAKIDPTGNRVSPLIFSITLKSAPVVDLLLKYGGDINAQWCNKSALEHMHERHCPQINESLLKHAALLSARGAFLHEKNIGAIESRPASLLTYQNCLQRLGKMKDTQVHADFALNYFEVLTKPHKWLAARLRDDQIKDSIQRTLHTDTFGVYTKDLQAQYSKACNYWRQVLQFENVLMGIFDNVFPNCVIRTFSEFYNEQDFVNLVSEQQ